MEALVLQHLGRRAEARAALEGVGDAIPTARSPRHDDVRALAAIAAAAQGGMHALRAGARFRHLLTRFDEVCR